MPAVGEAAPEWRARDAEGERIRFPRGLGDGPVVLVFWAHWCPYCKALLPRLDTLAQDAHFAGVRFVAVRFADQESGPEVEAAATATPHLRHVPRGDGAADRFRVDKVPALFLVQDGRIRYRLDYPPDDHPAQRAAHGREQAALLAEWWEQRLRGVLAEALATDPATP